MVIHRDVGLETLLELDGSVLEQEDGFWIRIDVRVVEASEHNPHGIRYSLPLMMSTVRGCSATTMRTR